LPVAGLRHEAVDDAMERHIVVKMLAREHLQPRGVKRRDVVVKLDDDPAVIGFEVEGILRVETGGKRLSGDLSSTHDDEH
jgi:hypothetical protein